MKTEITTNRQQQNIINCGFGADNQGFCAASASVFFDRKACLTGRQVPRNPQLIIFAERYVLF
jgi:hypothetical protein